MVEKVASDIINGNIVIVDLSWALALEEAYLGVVGRNHLDGLLSKTKLALIEFALVTKNTE